MFMRVLGPHLRPYPGQETLPLLCDIVYELGHAAICDNITMVQQWTGPPPGIIQAQVMLYASFATSMLSALVATLVKQWLSYYASVDVQASAIERGTNRQRKLNGLVTWHFHRVRQLPLLMLQGAGLLFVSAISRYVWAINTTLTWNVLGLTFVLLVICIPIVALGRPSRAAPIKCPDPAFFVWLPVL